MPKSPGEIEADVRLEAIREQQRYVNGLAKKMEHKVKSSRYSGEERRCERATSAGPYRMALAFFGGLLLAVIPLLAMQLMNFTPRAEMQTRFDQVQAAQKKTDEKLSAVQAEVAALSQQMADLKEYIQEIPKRRQREN